MKLSVRSDYAARAVLGLAHYYPAGRAVRVEQLAEEQRIPATFLIQILLELKSAGIVRSVRGKQGGYLLAHAPGSISLGDVIRAVHGDVFDTPALQDPDCPAELRRAWRHLQTSLEAAANSVVFQELLNEQEGKDRMYYI